MEMQNKIPEWDAPGNEPPAELKKTGFEAGYKPPAAYFNWFWHAVGMCLKELFALLSGHAADKENPHGVTAEQLGLDKVNNTSDTEKYVKYAQTAGSAEKVGYAMTIRLNGGRTEGSDAFTFDGSTSRTVNVTPAKIGAAEADLSNVDASAFKQLADNAGVGGGTPIVTAASTDGATYTATVQNVAELYSGLTITIIPDTTSASTAPTLNINGLGAKPIRLPLSTNNVAMAQPGNAAYFTAGNPITLQFDASYLNTGAWKTLGKQRQAADDLYGNVPIANGGTGADNASDARSNLGAAAKSQGAALTVAASAWAGDGPYTATVECTLAKASNNLVVGAGGELTANQQAAIAAAMIVCTAQAAGSITLTAFGAMPEIDIPVNVLEVG